MKIVSSARSLALMSLFVIGALAGKAAAESPREPLADEVRSANARFQDVSVAVAEGYAPIPCASGNDGGAMGVHYVNPNYLKDTAVPFADMNPDVTCPTRERTPSSRSGGLPV